MAAFHPAVPTSSRLAIHLSCLLSPPVFPPTHMAGGDRHGVPTYSLLSSLSLPAAYESRDINWRTKLLNVTAGSARTSQAWFPGSLVTVQCRWREERAGQFWMLISGLGTLIVNVPDSITTTTVFNISAYQHLLSPCFTKNIHLR